MWADLRKKTYPYAALSALIAGLMTHLFGWMNVLHNCDDIGQQAIGYGTGITSGRWLLSILGDGIQWLGGGYNIPFLNGITTIVLIALAAGFFVDTYQICERRNAALIGCLFVVFPSLYSTLTFRYTAVYYALGFLMAVIAVWICDRIRGGCIWAAILIACSMGIYQAYVPMTIAMFVLLLIQKTLLGASKVPQILKDGFRYAGILGLGLCLYYGFLNLCLDLYGTSLSDYQGVDKMGRLSVTALPGLVKEAVYSVCMMPFRDYCGLSASRSARGLYSCIGILSAVLTWLQLRKYKDPGRMVLVLLLWCVFPVAANFIVVMCPDSWVYTLMLYPLVILPCVPLVLSGVETVSFSRWWKRGSCLLGILLALVYGYQTNVNYVAQYYSNRQVENYMTSLVTQVRMTEGFRADQKWVVIGEIQDPLLGDYWDYAYTIGGPESAKGLLQRHSWGDWMHHYTGYQIPEAEDSVVEQLVASDRVKTMPVWPNQGSIQIIDDTVVIKFQEI